MSAFCGVCGNDEPDHRHLNHEFTEGSELIPKKTPEHAAVPNIRVTSDLVLRKALIDAGLISGDDIIKAGEELRNGLGIGGTPADRAGSAHRH